MNTTTFELRIDPENKDLFLKWNKENEGPHFVVDESRRYFDDREEFKEYYNSFKDNEITLITVVPVYCERILMNHLGEAAKYLNIGLKYLIFYQDPGTGEASGYWAIY